jgi:hypothetical protein
MTIRRLMRLRSGREDIGFYQARVLDDDGPGWRLQVVSPADPDAFRHHLATGSSMTLSMVTRDGDYLRGEAAVSGFSESTDAATTVTLAGVGPLYAT